MAQNNTEKLKLVKKAHLVSKGDSQEIVHYETVIFSYNTVTKKAWALMDCSLTSNKQIRFAERFFNPIKTERKSTGFDKWAYHGDITQ